MEISTSETCEWKFLEISMEISTYKMSINGISPDWDLDADQRNSPSLAFSSRALAWQCLLFSPPLHALSPLSLRPFSDGASLFQVALAV